MRNVDLRHKKTITDFLYFLNQYSADYILKGGTALMVCYKLDRFSEDIDLDGKSAGIDLIVDEFCKINGNTYRIAKDTAMVKRFMINYGNCNRPLKIEVSFRKETIDESEFDKICGIRVYNINSLCIMKANAYSSRDRIRDLYDITFICNNYWEQLNDAVKALVRETILHKGIVQFDYLVKNQPDELVNTDKLADSFLKMYDRLGLLAEDGELYLIKKE